MWYLQRYRCKGWLSLCSRNYHYRQARKESKRVGRRKSFLAGSYEFLALVQFLGLSHASIPHPFSLFFINFFLYISSLVMRCNLLIDELKISLRERNLILCASVKKNFSSNYWKRCKWGTIGTWKRSTKRDLDLLTHIARNKACTRRTSVSRPWKRKTSHGSDLFPWPRCLPATSSTGHTSADNVHDLDSPSLDDVTFFSLLSAVVCK